MRIAGRLFNAAAAMGSIYKILLTGCLIYELLRFRYNKTAMQKAAPIKTTREEQV